MARTHPAPLAAALAILALGIAHLLPAGAYPSTGIATASILLLLAVWGLFECWRAKVALPLLPVTAGIAFLVWSFIGWLRMDVREAADATNARLFIGLAGFLCALSWMKLSSSQEGLPRRVGTIFVDGMAIILLTLSIHAIWQRYVGYADSLNAILNDPNAYAHDPVMREAIIDALQKRTPGSTFGDPNTLAALAALGIGLIAGIAAMFRRPASAALCAALAGICLFAVAVTQSRGGALTALAAIAGGIFLVFQGLKSSGFSRRQLRLFVIAIAGLVVIAIAALSIVLATTSLGREWQRRLAAISTGAQRVYYLRSATAIWSEAPIAGSGPGSFALLYPSHRIAGAGETADPHNWAARILAEHGLVGLCLFGCWFIASLRRVRVETLAMTAGLGALLLLLNGFIQHGFSTREVYLDFSILLGIAASSSPCKRHWRPMALAAIALMAALAWPMWMKPDRVETMMDRSQEWLSEASSLRMRGDSLGASLAVKQALGDLHAALELSPEHAAIHDAMAVAYFYSPEVREPQRAIELEQRAIELNPYSASYHNRLAAMLQALGRHQEALSEWDKALSKHPLDEEIYAQRSLAHEQSGNLQAALEDARQAARLTMRSNERYKKRYEELLMKIEAVHSSS